MLQCLKPEDHQWWIRRTHTAENRVTMGDPASPTPIKIWATNSRNFEKCKEIGLKKERQAWELKCSFRATSEPTLKETPEDEDACSSLLARYNVNATTAPP